jgi:hypothetical protein
MPEPTQSPCSRSIAGGYSLTYYGIRLYKEAGRRAGARVSASVLHDIDTFLHGLYTFSERATRPSSPERVVKKNSPAIAGLGSSTEGRVSPLVVATPAPVTRTCENKHPGSEQRQAGGLRSGRGRRWRAIVIIVVLVVAFVVLLFILSVRERIHETRARLGLAPLVVVLVVAVIVVTALCVPMIAVAVTAFGVTVIPMIAVAVTAFGVTVIPLVALV